MRAADLHDVPEIVRFRAQPSPKLPQRRKQAFMEEQCRGHMHRGRNDVVARLTSIDVVVRMHLLSGLFHQMRNHLVRVHVGGGAASRLKNVDDKLGIELPLRDPCGCGFDRVCLRRRKLAQLPVGRGRGRLDEPERAQKRPLKSQAAERKVFDGPLGLSSVERSLGHRYVAHRIMFHAQFVIKRCH